MDSRGDHGRFAIGPLTPEERFWAKVVKSEGCWLWIGSRHPFGYGHFTISRTRRTTAHRAAFEFTYGPIPEGAHICHRCDNPPCVRPDHLFVGDHSANMADRHIKGRYGTMPKGDQRVNSKLTRDNVVIIKQALAMPGQTYSALGRRFGVSAAAIREIHHGRNWKHV